MRIINNYNILQIRSEFRDNGPGTQSLEIARELKKRSHEIYFASSGGVLAKEIKKEFKHFNLPLLAVNKRGIYSTFKNIFKIKEIIKENNINIVHAHNAASAFISYLSSKLINRKILITHSVRGMETRNFYKWRNLIYKMYKANFYAVSKYTKNLLINAGVKSDDIIVTYNGVNLSNFNYKNFNNNKFRKEIGVSPETVLIGTVGRVNYNKGQTVLIRSIPYIKEKFSDFKIIIVGEGNKLKECRSIAKKLNVEDHVYFTGFRRDIPNIQASIDIFTLASVKGEMFPNAILEAMAMKNPWVASKLSGIPEMSNNGSNGLLSEPNNEIDLAKKLLILIKNKDKRIKMGENAYKTVLENYTINKVCDKIENSYSNYFN